MKGSKSNGTKGKQNKCGTSLKQPQTNGKFSNVVSSVVKDVFGVGDQNETVEAGIDNYTLNSKDVALEMDDICYVPSCMPQISSKNDANKPDNGIKRIIGHYSKVAEIRSINRIDCNQLSYSNRMMEDILSISTDSDSTSIGDLTPPLMSSTSSLDSHSTDCNANIIKRSVNQRHSTPLQTEQLLNEPTQPSNVLLADKVGNLEYMYENLLFLLEDERKALLQLSHERDATRRYLSKSFQQDLKALVQRVNKVEAHVVSLARSIAYISSDVRQQNILKEELNSLKNEMSKVQLTGGSSGNDSCLKKDERLRLKLSKLKRFFGTDPKLGLLESFLKQLGYEKYLKKFTKEDIGVLELLHITEVQLENIGIPCGPRQRILAHIKEL